MKGPNVLKNIPPLRLLHHNLFSMLTFGAKIVVPKMQELTSPQQKKKKVLYIVQPGVQPTSVLRLRIQIIFNYSLCGTSHTDAVI